MTIFFSVSPKWGRGGPPKDKETIDIYGNGNLTCDVTAVPAASFSWYKDGKPVTLS